MDIARDHGQMMLQRCGRQQSINDRQGSALSLCIAGELSPAIGDGGNENLRHGVQYFCETRALKVLVPRDSAT
jgi:hypothetical protein